MTKQVPFKRAPRNHSSSTVYVGRCPKCGRRVEFKRMSVGLTPIKRRCKCDLSPRDFKAMATAAHEE